LKTTKLRTAGHISDDDELPIQPPVMHKQDVEVESKADLLIRGELMAERFSSNLEDIATWQVSSSTRAT
jgi:hypothetical protein